MSEPSTAAHFAPPEEQVSVAVAHLSARAIYLGAPLDVGRLRKADYLAEDPLVLAVGTSGRVVLFRYGVAVFFGVDAEEEKAFVDYLQVYLTGTAGPPPRGATEQATIIADVSARERAFDGVIWMSDTSVPRLQVVAHGIAASALLNHYEIELARVFDQLEPFATRLRTEGRITRKRREVVRDIGRALEIRVLTAGRAAIREKPEVLWDHPELERLHRRLDDEFDLSERADALEAKLAIVGDAANMAVNLLQHERSHSIEWLIVILILLEFLLALYDMIRAF
jgi:uncharacterized Rmd1/YagE family protein